MLSYTNFLWQTFLIDNTPYFTLFFYLLPEFLLLIVVLVLICIAVLTPKNCKGLLLSWMIQILLKSLSGLIIFLVSVFMYNFNQTGSDILLIFNYQLLNNSDLTLFLAYDTLKMTQNIYIIKICLLILGFITLLNIKRYLILHQLNNYEYPLIIILALISMLLTVEANNWILLFLTLELQALCFLVLFAWNRRCEKAINATLKFAVVNFIASTLVLIAFIEIILYTQSFNISFANPDTLQNFWLTQSLSTFNHVYQSEFLIWGVTQMLMIAGMSDINTYSNIWYFVSVLLALGFAMKFGLLPFGFWLQDLYLAVTLPVLHFFSTAPKLTYLFLLVSLYNQLFNVVNPEGFLFPFIFLGSFTIVMGNIILFTVKNNLLIAFAWSAIANMGLLFLLFGVYPLQNYGLIFLGYYLTGTIIFFLLLQYVVIYDKTFTIRHPLYFTDLAVLRTPQAYSYLLLVLAICLLNFFGIPPLLGFWAKFTVIYNIMLNALTMFDIFWLLCLLFISLIGSFTYLRILYTILVETHKTKLNLVFFPYTQLVNNYILKLLLVVQLIGFIYINTNSTNLIHLTVLLLIKPQGLKILHKRGFGLVETTGVILGTAALVGTGVWGLSSWLYKRYNPTPTTINIPQEVQNLEMIKDEVQNAAFQAVRLKGNNAKMGDMIEARNMAHNAVIEQINNLHPHATLIELPEAALKLQQKFPMFLKSNIEYKLQEINKLLIMEHETAPLQYGLSTFIVTLGLGVGIAGIMYYLPAIKTHVRKNW